MENQIQIIQTTPKQLSELINESVKTQLEGLKRELQSKEDKDQLLSRTEVCKLLQIDPSTLWNWTNKGKVKAYGIGNKRYYKKSEILESINLLKK